MIEKNEKGITLIALIITIIILLILAGITIVMLTGEKGILKKSKIAKEENNKQTATEIINLKITNAQIENYSQKQQMPTLKELSLALKKDEEIEYITESSKVASVEYSVNSDSPSEIYTKLKEYPYEFEINGLLQLTSIDGIKVSTNNTNNDNNAEIEELKEKVSKLETMVIALQNNTKKSKLIESAWRETTDIIPAAEWVVIDKVSLAGNGTGKAIISYSASTRTNTTEVFQIDINKNDTMLIGMDGEYSNQLTHWKRGSISSTISYDENTTISFRVNSRQSSKVAYVYSILLLSD